MLSGKPPFTSENKSNFEIEKRILENKVNFPPFFTLDAQDLISQLLKSNPEERLEIKGLKSHRFFKDLDWVRLKQLKISSPLKIKQAKVTNKHLDIKETYDLNSLPDIEGFSYDKDKESPLK